MGAATVCLIVTGDAGSGRILLGGSDVGVDVKQLTERERDFHVKIVEELPPLLEKGVQVVGVILKERRFAVGRLQRIPMQSPPLAVVADADVARERLVCVVTDGDGQCLR